MSQKKSIIIFIGPPGSGKGTLSQMCVHELGWEQLSTGQLCRKHVSQGTEIGQRIDFAIKSGKLIPDALIIDMVKSWLEQHLLSANGIILDGFPRTVDQARALDVLIDALGDTVKMQIVRLHVPDTIVIERLSNRVICQNRDCQAVFSRDGTDRLQGMSCEYCGAGLIRRADDEPNTISDRLNTYHLHAQSLFDYYADKGSALIQLDVNKPLDQVFSEFKKLL